MHAKITLLKLAYCVCGEGDEVAVSTDCDYKLHVYLDWLRAFVERDVRIVEGLINCDGIAE